MHPALGHVLLPHPPKPGEQLRRILPTPQLQPHNTMPTTKIKPHCEGSPRFNPDTFFDLWNERYLPRDDDDFRGCLIRCFGLSHEDSYQYHAEMAVVTLADAQQVIKFGGVGGLHAWYRDENEKELPRPPPVDTNAYIALFYPSSSLTKALTALRSNAKKDSLRAQIATHLESQLRLPTAPGLTLPAKSKAVLKNPYLDLWAWSSLNLEWAGPMPSNEKTSQAHHILPVYYHHFGCVVPSHAALTLISQLAQPDPSIKPRPKTKQIIEIGSGTGYWTYILRRTFPELTVVPIDNLMSKYRTRWIGDTLAQDGPTYLTTHKGGEGSVLLLVYPSVGGDFTGKVLRAFQGDAVVVAGTQNNNGFTGFKGETVADWVARERTDWEEAARIPLPSFAGKDEALFVFKKRST